MEAETEEASSTPDTVLQEVSLTSEPSTSMTTTTGLATVSEDKDWPTCLFFWRGKDPRQDWELGWKSEKDEEEARKEQQQYDEETKEEDVKEPDPRFTEDPSRGKRPYEFAIGFRWESKKPGKKDWYFCWRYPSIKSTPSQREREDAEH